MMDADDPRHGTQNGYGNHGCRCDACIEAHSTHQRTDPRTIQSRKNYGRSRLEAQRWVRMNRPDVWAAITAGADADDLVGRGFEPVDFPARSTESNEEGT